MKRKFVALMVVIVLSLTSLTACGAKTPQDIVSEALGLDASGGSEVSASDTHGGFHGDGTSCIVLTFQDDAVLEQIKANADWNSLPMDETTQILVYGISGEENHGLSNRSLSERQQRQPAGAGSQERVLFSAGPAGRR